MGFISDVPHVSSVRKVVPVDRVCALNFSAIDLCKYLLKTNDKGN